MKLDPEYLRQHYAMLSDEALLEIERGDLVEMAQKIYDEEVGRRNPAAPDHSRGARPDLPDDADDQEMDREPHAAGGQPDWMDEASEVYAHAIHSASQQVPEAVLTARDALESAGIACSLELCEIPPEKSSSPHGTHEWRVMVPGNLNLPATSVLEREIFNPEFEAGWKAHLEALSDEEFRALNPEVALCGLFDRIARVKRAYAQELARRKAR